MFSCTGDTCTNMCTCRYDDSIFDLFEMLFDGTNLVSGQVFFEFILISERERERERDPLRYTQMSFGLIIDKRWIFVCCTEVS